MEDRRPKMEDGRWKMEDGRWKMEDGIILEKRGTQDVDIFQELPEGTKVLPPQIIPLSESKETNDGVIF
jgi:hypothetical protein